MVILLPIGHSLRSSWRMYHRYFGMFLPLFVVWRFVGSGWVWRPNSIFEAIACHSFYNFNCAAAAAAISRNYSFILCCTRTNNSPLPLLSHTHHAADCEICSWVACALIWTPLNGMHTLHSLAAEQGKIWMTIVMSRSYETDKSHCFRNVTLIFAGLRDWGIREMCRWI